jgi:release factor glutamine methyltransferase
VPLAHLTGFKEFWSLPFEISRGVFIPRPETELVVEKVLELASKKSPTLIVDIGTGAGNIALALALEMPKARILATDISRRALKIASRNARRAKAANVTFLEGHLFSPLKKISGLTKPDFVVSNPPYVAQEDWPRLPLEILRYEPKRALFAGKTGLEVIHPLIKGAARFLKPGGYLVMEIGQGQQQRILSLFDSRWMEVQAGLDLAGISRVIVARKA